MANRDFMEFALCTVLLLCWSKAKKGNLDVTAYSSILNYMLCGNRCGEGPRTGVMVMCPQTSQYSVHRQDANHSSSESQQLTHIIDYTVA